MIVPYALASLSPAVLIALAALAGGGWPLAALLWVTAFVALADRLSDRLLPLREDGRAERAARRLSVLLGLVHIPLFFLGVRALAGPDVAPAGKAALFLALGLYAGQVFNSNAHELIHRAGRWPRRLGAAVYVVLLFGHHASAHRLVHHVHVATPADPNTPRRGEGAWRFLPRAWIGSFREGLRAETALRRRSPRPAPLWRHPYLWYCAGAAAALGVSLALAGTGGLLAHLGLAAYATMQLLISDYVQHYGLERGRMPDGRLEPAGPRHSWNAPGWYSGAMMLNAPRHSDHHMNPARAFPALRLDPRAMPMLPRPLPVMGALALVPPLWRRVMDRRAARWRAAAHGVAAPDLRDSAHATPAADSRLPV